MAKLIGAKGGSGSPKGGGSIVSTTRNSSYMDQKKGNNEMKSGANIAKASTPTKSGPKASGGSTGSSPSIHKTHSGTTQAGDAGTGLGGSRKLGCIYGNK
jgi:hypothetical protein